MSKSVKINSIKFDFKNISTNTTGSGDEMRSFGITYVDENDSSNNENLKVEHYLKSKMLKIYNNDTHQSLVFHQIKTCIENGAFKNCTKSSEDPCSVDFKESTTDEGIGIGIAADYLLWT